MHGVLNSIPDIWLVGRGLKCSFKHVNFGKYANKLKKTLYILARPGQKKYFISSDC